MIDWTKPLRLTFVNYSESVDPNVAPRFLGMITLRNKEQRAVVALGGNGGGEIVHHFTLDGCYGQYLRIVNVAEDQTAYVVWYFDDFGNPKPFGVYSTRKTAEYVASNVTIDYDPKIKSIGIVETTLPAQMIEAAR